MAFPASLDTFHTCVNNLTFSLTADYVAGDGTIYVNSTTGAPAAGSFHMGSNCIYYTGKTANSFTGCTGGNDGTADVDQLMVDGGNEVVFGPEAHNVNDLNTAMGNVQGKIGIDGSADTDSHDYKLSGVTGAYKAFSTENVIDEDNMASNLDTKVPTQQSVKAYADAMNLIITATASSATPTPAIASKKTLYCLTALAEAAVFGAPTGSPANGDLLMIRIKDNGTARALSFNAIYRAMGVTLPTTTVLSKTMYLLFIYNSADSKWDLIAKTEEA